MKFRVEGLAVEIDVPKNLHVRKPKLGALIEWRCSCGFEKLKIEVQSIEKSLTDKISNFNTSLENIKGEISTMKVNLETISNKVNSLRKNVQEAEAEYANLNQEYEEISRDLETKEGIHKNQKDEITEIQDKIKVVDIIDFIASKVE